MNINDEFDRLQAHLSIPEKWQELDEAWQIALNYEKRNGEWFKKTSGTGDSVSGFAIDLETRKYEIGVQGRNHDDPRVNLIRRLVKEGDVTTFDEGAERVVRGWMTNIDGWAFPLIQLNGFWDDSLGALEQIVLEERIALPLRGLRQKFMPT